MSRRAIDIEYRRAQTIIAAIYLLLIGLLAMATASAEDTLRKSTSRHHLEGGRSDGPPPVETEDVFDALETLGKRVRPHENDSREAAGDTPPSARATAGDFWIYDADVILFGDDDRDGYYFGIDLLFDADTVWSSARVYAVMYLSLDGGPWNEYAATEDFRIDGATSGDEYVLVTELQSGYPTGDYDLLIELYDADTGWFLADYGPESSSALSFLPLEDFNRDAPVVDRPVTVSEGRGGGGAAGVLPLLGLAALAWRRRAPVHRIG